MFCKLQSQIDIWSSPEGKAKLKTEKEIWESDYNKFQNLYPQEITLGELQSTTIPDLEKQVKDETRQIEEISEEVEENKSRVARARVATRDLQTLKSAASMVTRTLGEISDLKSDIGRLEKDLEASGSLKTVEDVQREVEQISSEM